MTDTQLYFSIGVPGLIALVGILVNTALFVHLSTSLGTRISALDAKIDHVEEKLEGRIDALESKIDTRFDLLIGKIGEMDVRLARLEDRMEHFGR